MKKTPLFDLHLEAGARMVEFAGYEMPVQYPLGVKKEHLWVREHAGLFDVSHMGQVMLSGENIKIKLEEVLPVDVLGLEEGKQRYGLFTTADGGISDDLMFANWGDEVFVVVNASCKEQDIEHMKASLVGCNVVPVENRALLALQGPSARSVMSELVPEVADMVFMHSKKFVWNGVELWVSCSGYTGEDGYEISVPAEDAANLSNALLSYSEVEWIGLGARDSLRLEAGLCLYGHDIDVTTTPVSASLNWAIQKVRRLGGEREGGFLGANKILPEFDTKPMKKRAGFIVDGKVPVREGCEVVNEDGQVVGLVTSGGFSPSLSVPIVMAYIQTEMLDSTLCAVVRGKNIPLIKTAMPFVSSNYFRG
ncbi:glycine cleavage system aminomethyltransferase GcvT [Marinomonas sp. 2405UD68-3]|uniref:glycine cleavage system aminomethyltransferase GcvT n=1 Tax=Marinomonas sp. 2405UD68-3 TaxID=3391835 RepID=UPI0039C91037